MPQINTRLRQKIDIETNWNKATNFIPLDGEIIIYKADENHPYERIKIGDGETPVIDLAFINSIDASLTQSGQAADAKAVGDALENKMDKNAVSDTIKDYFLIVETVKDGANYLLDGITFSELYDKFQLGNVNMVCHVDGTDYIPLLSVTPRSIIFSGIYNATSVSLVFDSEGVGTLSTTYLCDRSSLTTHTSDKDIHITAEERTLWNGFSNKADKSYVDEQTANLVGIDNTITEAMIDEICGITQA